MDVHIHAIHWIVIYLADRVIFRTSRTRLFAQTRAENDVINILTGEDMENHSDSECSLFYYINTCEIPGFLLLLKNHIFIARSEDTIFIFHM